MSETIIARKLSDNDDLVYRIADNVLTEWPINGRTAAAKKILRAVDVYLENTGLCVKAVPVMDEQNSGTSVASSDLLGTHADCDSVTLNELRDHIAFGRAYGQNMTPTVEWDARMCRTLHAAFVRIKELMPNPAPCVPEKKV